MKNAVTTVSNTFGQNFKFGFQFSFGFIIGTIVFGVFLSLLGVIVALLFGAPTYYI